MNREIKFRAWSKLGKEMLRQDEIRHLALAELEMESNLIWMFSTGQKDKNGADIFEGDVLNAPMRNGANRRNTREKLFPAEVYWSQTQSGFQFSPKGDIWTGDYRFYPRWNECEIIGNIYENPDLLPALVAALR